MLAIAFASLVGLALAASPRAGAPVDELQVLAVRGPLPAGAALVLAKATRFYGDFGTIAVAEGTGAAARSLRAAGLEVHEVGTWPAGELLMVADREHVGSAATVLFHTDVQYLVSGAEPSGGCRCGHGAAIVDRRPIPPAAPFQRPGGAAKALSVDARVAALAAQVSSTNIQSTVAQLQSYFTRRADSATILQAKDWLVQRFQTYPGVTVSTSTFSGSYAPNIVVTKTGASHPERVVVLGAHYDSINLSGSSFTAPGADDNASGSAGIVEVARILSTAQFENTIRFVLYSAEELGLLGSEADAAGLKAAGTQVVAMLNMDMIAHLEAGDSYDVDFASNNTDSALTQFCRDVTAAYVPALPSKLGVLTAGSSDHAAYAAEGFPAAFFFEDLTEYSHALHTANDTIAAGSANEFQLARDISKAFLATAALLASPVDLALTHVELGPQSNAGGPYPLALGATSLIGNTIASAAVFYRVGGGPWLQKALLPSGVAGQFVGSLPGVQPLGTEDYYLVATDSAGYEQWLPDAPFAGAATFSFTVGTSTTLFFDDFEGAANGWTSSASSGTNDWAKGAPQGENGDPGTAASGSEVRGTDLGGASSDGMYEPSVATLLESKVINCAGQTGVRLSYSRWLGVEDAVFDQALLQVNSTTVWQNPAGGGSDHFVDTAWIHHDLDIGPQANNNPSVRIRYRMQSDGGLEFGGWNVDDVHVYALTAGTVAPLRASEAYLSASQGGSVTFSLDGGGAVAHRSYVLALSASGSGAGTNLGPVNVPLVFDTATNLGFSLLNTPVFQNFAGTLSPSGTATATLNLPGMAQPGIAGLSLSFAFFTLAPVTYASNAVSLTFAL